MPLVTALLLRIAVVGGDPVVGAGRRGGVARRGGHAVDQRLLASVNSGVPLAVALLYRLNVTVPVGLSAGDRGLVGDGRADRRRVAGCWLVLIAGLMVTGSARCRW